MRLRTPVTLGLVGLIAVLSFIGFELRARMATMYIELVFAAVANGGALEKHAFVYDNPGGAGRFMIRDFQFFVSNIKLDGAQGSYVVPESYHLVRFDGDDGTFRLVLPDVPRDRYDTIELAVGIDPAANGSITPLGDLDPNGRMAWNWETGYKFLLLEGMLERDGARIPLVYHVGFDENYTPLSFKTSILPSAEPTIVMFTVHLLRLFDSDPRLDLATLPSVKFDRADAGRIAGQFPALLTIGEDPP